MFPVLPRSTAEQQQFTPKSQAVVKKHSGRKRQNVIGLIELVAEIERRILGFYHKMLESNEHHRLMSLSSTAQDCLRVEFSSNQYSTVMTCKHNERSMSDHRFKWALY